MHARELPPKRRAGARRGDGEAEGRRDRSAALRPQERLAALLGARAAVLLCEELALRARLDLDHGRLALAAVELDSALAAALGELSSEQPPRSRDPRGRAGEAAPRRRRAGAARARRRRAATPAAAEALDEEVAARIALGRLGGGSRAPPAPRLEAG